MKDKTIKDTKIKCDIKGKTLSAEDMKQTKGGGRWHYYCCGRPPRYY